MKTLNSCLTPPRLIKIPKYWRNYLRVLIVCYGPACIINYCLLVINTDWTCSLLFNIVILAFNLFRSQQEKRVASSVKPFCHYHDGQKELLMLKCKTVYHPLPHYHICFWATQGLEEGRVDFPFITLNLLTRIIIHTVKQDIAVGGLIIERELLTAHQMECGNPAEMEGCMDE